MAFTHAIPRQRLHAHRLAGNAAASPHEVVSHFGAIQAQDYLGALWAIGARMKNATVAGVEEAIAARKIVRCWPMRGTLHFVAAEDARWMLELLAPSVLKRHRTRLERDFSIDRAVVRRARGVIERKLRGRAMTRAELYATLDAAKVPTGKGRGLHLIFALAHEQVICFGERSGKQPTFVLLDEWLPASKPKPRDEALAELATRYLQSHGPATATDFAWWAGLTPKEAKEAIALAGEPRSTTAKKTGALLLPPFDEYTVAYRDRSAVLDPRFAKKVNAGGGMLNAIVVVDGLVAGTWKRTIRGKSVRIETNFFGDAADLTRARKRYAKFLGLSLAEELQ